MTYFGWSRNWHPLVAAALLAPLLGVFAPLGLAPLFILVAFSSVALSWRERPWLAIDRHVAVAAAAFLAWSLASVFWSPDLPQALRTFFALTAEAFGGLCLVAIARRLDEDIRHRLTMAAAIGLILALVIVAVETRFGLVIKPVEPNMSPDSLVFMRGNRLSRGLVLASILAFPVMLSLRRQGRILIALALLVALTVSVAGSPTLAPKLALPVALVVAGAAFLWPRLTLRGWGALMVLVILAMPAAFLLPPPQEAYDRMPWLKGSSHHRLTIWRFTATNILEKPLFGWGLDGSRNIPGADDEIVYYRGPHVNGYDSTEPQLPLHPHNAALQWWLEVGLVGVVLINLFLAAVLAAFARQERSGVAPALATMAAATVVAMVSFGIWQSWWQSGLWLIAAMVAAMVPPSRGCGQS